MTLFILLSWAIQMLGLFLQNLWKSEKTVQILRSLKVKISMIWAIWGNSIPIRLAISIEKKSWEKIIIDTISWENIFERSTEPKKCNMQWLVNFNSLWINQNSTIIENWRYLMVHTRGVFTTQANSYDGAFV